MRYFFYISDAKVNMLHSQIPADLGKTQKTIFKGGIGKWLGVERHIEKQFTPDADTLKKLEAVCRKLRDEKIPSKISDLNAEWVEDIFECYISYPVESEIGAPVVLFQHANPPSHNPQESLTQLLLVGSAAYLMPRSESEKNVTPLPPGGHWAFLSKCLKRVMEGERIDDDNFDWGFIRLPCGDGPYRMYGPNGPLTRVKSMYRVLHRFNHTDQNVSLGTPLYVELL